MYGIRLFKSLNVYLSLSSSVQVVIERFKVAQLIMGQSKMVNNAADQSCNGGMEATHYSLVMCADLPSAVSAEAACIWQEKSSDGAEGDVGYQALLAVLHGARELGVGDRGADRGEPACVAHARALSRRARASSSVGSGDMSVCECILLLLVPKGQEGVVATAAEAAKWALVGAQLLESIQGLVVETDALLPMLFQT